MAAIKHGGMMKNKSHHVETSLFIYLFYFFLITQFARQTTNVLNSSVNGYFNHGLNYVRDWSFPKLKTQLNDIQVDKNWYPNGVKCNVKRYWVSILRLRHARTKEKYRNGRRLFLKLCIGLQIYRHNFINIIYLMFSNRTPNNVKNKINFAMYLIS